MNKKEKLKIGENMRRNGQPFVAAIGIEFEHSDSKGGKKILKTFSKYIEKYKGEGGKKNAPIL